MSARATVHLTTASLIYIITGYSITLLLGRHLGPTVYGNYGVIISLMTLLNLIQTSGIPQTLAHFVAGGKYGKIAILRQALNIQFILGLGLSMVLFIISFFAGPLLGDESLGKYIALSALILPIYGIYSVYIGYYNGERLFSKQASLNIAYSLAKCAAVLVLVYFFGLPGAILGFIVSPIIALAVGGFLPHKSNGVKIPTKTLLLFTLPLIGFSFLTTLMISIDLFMVKKIIIDDSSVGFYVAAQNISLIPYLGLSAFSQIILPSVSNLYNKKYAYNASVLFNKYLKLLIMLLVPLVVLLSGLSKLVVDIMFGYKFEGTAEALRFLVFGYGFMTLFMFYCNCAIGIGKPYLALVLSATGALLIGTLCMILIPINGIQGAGQAILMGASVAVLISHLTIRKYLDVRPPWKLLIALTVASALIYEMLGYLSMNYITMIVGGLVGLAIYLGVLYMLKEINIAAIKTFINKTVIKH